jgi:hypothetical protein
MWLLGLALLAVYIVAQLYYAANIVSVWCFFAALISIVVIFILRKKQTSISS